MFLLIPYAESRALNLITVIFLWPSCTDLQTNKLLQSLTCLAMPPALELICLKAQLLQSIALTRTIRDFGNGEEPPTDYS